MANKHVRTKAKRYAYILNKPIKKARKFKKDLDRAGRRLKREKQAKKAK